MMIKRFMLVSVVVAAGCTGQSGTQREGLEVLRADPATGFDSKFVAGNIKLEMHASLTGDGVESLIRDQRGVALSHIIVAADANGADEIRDLVENAAERSADAFKGSYDNDAAMADLVFAYVTANDALATQLPSSITGSLRSAFEWHGSILAAAVLKTHPDLLLHNAAVNDALNAARPFMLMQPASNDDCADYKAEIGAGSCPPPPASGTPSAGSGALKLQYYYDSQCAGACGPGCAWCGASVNGVHVCYTNSYCWWHDAHCGSYLHFFQCTLAPNGVY